MGATNAIAFGIGDVGTIGVGVEVMMLVMYEGATYGDESESSLHAGVGVVRSRSGAMGSNWSYSRSLQVCSRSGTQNVTDSGSGVESRYCSISGH